MMSIRLLPLVLGAFAIGTETFMITGVLPNIATDLRVSPAAAGGLVTIFALTYAFGSPLVAIASAGMGRKRLLTPAVGAFAIGNVARAVACVSAGMPLPMVVGVPIGTLIAAAANWRATFFGVAALAAIATLGVV